MHYLLCRLWRRRRHSHLRGHSLDHILRRDRGFGVALLAAARVMLVADGAHVRGGRIPVGRGKRRKEKKKTRQKSKKGVGLCFSDLVIVLTLVEGKKKEEGKG